MIATDFENQHPDKFQVIISSEELPVTKMMLIDKHQKYVV